MKQEADFFAEVNRLATESGSALRRAEPLLLLQASQALGQMISKWHKSDLDVHAMARLNNEIASLERVIDQLKLQQSLLLQQKAQVEKQLKVLLPGWSNGLYVNTSGLSGEALGPSTSVRA